MKEGEVLISDIKQDTERIQTILKNERYFNNFLKYNENFINNIVSKVSNGILSELKIADSNIDYDTLTQVGRVALFIAMQNFTNDKNAGLSTFAYKVISNDVTRHVKRQLRVKFHEESIESFTSKNNTSAALNYDESHFLPLYGKSGQFEEEVLNKIVFDEHYSNFTDEQKQVYKMLSQGITFKEIRRQTGIKRRRMRKICERELPQKIEKMKKAMFL